MEKRWACNRSQKMSYSKSMIDMTIQENCTSSLTVQKCFLGRFCPRRHSKVRTVEYVKQSMLFFQTEQHGINVWFFNQIEPESFTDIVFILITTTKPIFAEDIVFSKEGAYMPDNGYSLLKKTDSESFKENGNDFLIRHMVAHMKYKYTCVEGSIFLKANGTPWLTESNMFPWKKGTMGGHFRTVLQLPFTECVRST